MTEKIKISGEVLAFSNPFSLEPNEILMVKTSRGLVCVPVEDFKKYEINQPLEISITIKSREKVKDV